MKMKRNTNLVLLAVLIFSMGALGFHIVTAETEALTSANAGEIIINEFTTDYPDTVELYNTLPSLVDLTGWQLSCHVYSAVPQNALVPFANITVSIPANGYVVLNNTHFTETGDWKAGYDADFSDLYDKGDEIVLTNTTGHVVDVVGYGYGGSDASGGGSAPGISDTDSFSVARVANTGNNGTDWNLDRTPTWGAENDAPGVDLGGVDVVINEVDSDNDFVELYNTHSYDIIDLDGWFLSCPDDTILYLSGLINPKGFVTFYSDYVSNNPLTMYEPYDTLYLYNSSGHRVDQMGWGPDAQAEVLGKSWNRYPDGTGGNHDGYNNVTSGFTLLNPSPGATNSNTTYATIQDVAINQSTVALDGSVDVAVKATWSNGTIMDSASASVDFNGTPIALTFDAGSDYFNGTIDFTGFVPQTDVWGEYHTTELTFMVDGTTSNVSKTAGIFVNPGYAAADTVIMFDESHDTFYDFHTAGKAGYVLSWILETEMADYFVILDAYDFYFRLDSAVVTDVDLLIIPDPDSDLTDAWLTSSEVDTIVDYVESGGSLWLSSSRGYFSNPDVNGLAAITSNWGIAWYDGSYQDDVNNKGSNYNAKVTPEFADGSSFDDFDAFGVEEYYYNGMVINHTTDVVGVNVTKAVPARYGSTWENDSIAGYDADMNSLVDEFAIAYVVETGTGKAFVTGSCSVYTYPSDYEDDMQSGQFVFNVFAYLLGIDPIQYPTLTLTDMVGAQTVVTTDTSVSFKVKLSSSLSGATFSNVEVSGLLSGSLVTFTDAGNGEYTATWDATTVSAGTYTLVVSATAENAAGALFIPTTVSLTVTVEEPAGTTTTEPDTTTTGAAPGFGIATLLTTLSLIGVAYTFIRKRR